MIERFDKFVRYNGKTYLASFLFSEEEREIRLMKDQFSKGSWYFNYFTDEEIKERILLYMNF